MLNTHIFPSPRLLVLVVEVTKEAVDQEKEQKATIIVQSMY